MIALLLLMLLLLLILMLFNFLREGSDNDDDDNDDDDASGEDFEEDGCFLAAIFRSSGPRSTRITYSKILFLFGVLTLSTT